MIHDSGPCSGRATSHAGAVVGRRATPIRVQQGGITVSEARCAQSPRCAANSSAAWAGGSYERAARLFEELTANDDFAEFLTLPAYALID